MRLLGCWVAAGCVVCVREGVGLCSVMETACQQRLTVQSLLLQLLLLFWFSILLGCLVRCMRPAVC